MEKSGDHQLIWSISHYLQGLIHPRWLFGISSIYDCCMCGVTPPFSIESWSWISETWSNWTTSSLSGKSKNRLQEKKIIVWIWHHKKTVPFKGKSSFNIFQPLPFPCFISIFLFKLFYSSNIFKPICNYWTSFNKKLSKLRARSFHTSVKHLHIKSPHCCWLTSPTPISYLRKDWRLPEANSFCTWKWRPLSSWDTPYVQGRSGC